MKPSLCSSKSKNDNKLISSNLVDNSYHRLYDRVIKLNGTKHLTKCHTYHKTTIFALTMNWPKPAELFEPIRSSSFLLLARSISLTSDKERSVMMLTGNSSEEPTHHIILCWWCARIIPTMSMPMIKIANRFFRTRWFHIWKTTKKYTSEHKLLRTFKAYRK